MLNKNLLDKLRKLVKWLEIARTSGVRREHTVNFGLIYGINQHWNQRNRLVQEGGHSTYDSVFIRIMPKLEISMLTPIIRNYYIVTCYIHIMGTLNIVIIISLLNIRCTPNCVYTRRK